MTFTSFAGTFAWVIAHGYWLMFVGMLLEGPVITASASFAAALGYFNVGIVFLLSVLGDLVGDFAYYMIGYLGHVTLLKKYGPAIGISDERIEKIKYQFEKHPGKILTIIKLNPIMPIPGLIMAGAVRMPRKKFLKIVFLITLPKVIFFMVLGYYFGRAYDSIIPRLQNGAYLVIPIIAVLLLAYYMYKKITAALAKKVQGAESL